MADGVSADWSQVAAFASAVDAGLGKWLADRHGVGLTEYRALAHLAQAADRELRVNDLAQKVGLNQSSVTRMVSRLEDKGLTVRDLCPDDGRGVYAVLTDRGEELLREVRGPYEERLRDLLANTAVHYPHLDAARLRGAFAAIGGLIGA
ncbi:MarR family winged helix-turn-helix transcriptional regulator [Streptomonospora nanhaiensis]|uniref:DNA-binding MarR family transcriptional regulator n=1 Tax=Streptomonospora nanhaiensis TaxID=1323731 RepID=A0A853BL22_9ACTN|nr:MarR family transcriptional regulator [Streptomonospora nanhaiensis]MBV2363335.1 MarR family transcriptional regulator [Streptomonospora nanhaiensis]MBX9388524.1 MarR family transcriptional regulator [Streptomonospora nanhaiensis]NYI95700.1 DNA-binding MarR family transcriptional regulator [Streptomonospora nanhaiensis]